MPENKTEETTTTETKTTGTTRSTRSTRSSSSTRSTRSTRSAGSASTPAAAKTQAAAPRAKKAASSSPKTAKTWSEKVAAKSRKIDKLLNSTSHGFGRLAAGTKLDIKKRVSDKGPSAVMRMHFLGTVRQRKKLASTIQSILDA